MGASKFDEIFDYLKQEKLTEINTLDINDILGFIKSNKLILQERFSLSDNDFENVKKELSHFLKALITLNYCRSNDNNLYTKLFDCKNKDMIIETLNEKLPSVYSTSYNICKYIAREIKLIQKTNSNTTSINKDKNPLDNKVQLTLDILRKFIDKNNKSKFLNSLPDEKIHENILSWLQDDYNILPATIDEYILKYVNRPNPKKEVKTEITNLALINKEQKEFINKLKDENNISKKTIDELKEQLKVLSDENTFLNNSLNESKNKLEIFQSKDKELIKNLFSTSDIQIGPILGVSPINMNVPIYKPFLDDSYKFFSEQGMFSHDTMRNYNLNYDNLTINLSLQIVSSLYKLMKK